MSKRKQKELDDMTLDELKAEAERKGLTVKRAEGEGDPLKQDYLDALKTTVAGAIQQTEHAHGNLPNLDESAKAPGWTPAAIGKPAAGQPGTYRRPRRESEDERDERLQEEAERTIRVRAKRAGEYPPGTLRDIGAEFNFVIPKDAEEQAKEVDEEYKLPTWLEAIDEDGEVSEDYESREVGELSVAAKAAKADEEE